MRALAAAALLSVAVLGLAGCADPYTQTPASGLANDVAVVATTDVWGSVAQAIGGSHVTVTSIIDDPDKDPHEFTASARNQLELSRARLLIENGGGYDDFVDTMVQASSNDKLVTVNAVKASGHRGDADLNEHVWYDFAGVKRVAATIEAALIDLSPANARSFRANTAAFESQLDSLIADEATVKSTYAGQGAAITEPVPLYLLTAIGLDNKTPAAFSKAIEDGTDASPAVLQAAVQVFTSKTVKLLAYNEQTTGPETTAVLAAAKANGIPAVPVTETLPTGATYVSWMRGNLDAIEAALQR